MEVGGTGLSGARSTGHHACIGQGGVADITWTVGGCRCNLRRPAGLGGPSKGPAMTARNALIVSLALVGLAGAGLAAISFPAPAPAQSGDEDRPPIIISSGSVIMTVEKGNWTREAAGRFRQDVTR